MGNGISFHSLPNRGSTFWFYTNLDLNPSVITEGPSTQCLAGEHLVYAKPSSAAAQCMLDTLSETPLEAVYSSTFSALPPTHYDMVLLGITVTFHEPLAIQHERLVKAAPMTDFLMLTLPCHAQVNAEKLEQDGIGTCLLKPLAPTCLPPALTEFCHCKQNTLLPVTDESKLVTIAMVVGDNPVDLRLIGALLEDMV